MWSEVTDGLKLTYLKHRSGRAIFFLIFLLTLDSPSAQFPRAWFQKVLVLKCLGAVYISSKPIKPASRGWLIQIVACSVVSSCFVHFVSTEHCVKRVIFTIIVLLSLNLSSVKTLVIEGNGRWNATNFFVGCFVRSFGFDRAQNTIYETNFFYHTYLFWRLRPHIRSGCSCTLAFASFYRLLIWFARGSWN